MRQDERYGKLSYPARELFNGLITMADDEGRFRAPISAILGHVFPYDDAAPRKLRDWMLEIRDSGMVLFYVDGGMPYGAFRHWRRHQKINRPSPSVLPAPPDHDVVMDNSVNGSGTNHGTIIDDSLSHAQARVPVRSSPTEEEVQDEEERQRPKPSRKTVAQNELPSSLPNALHSTAASVLSVLEAVQAERGGHIPTLRGVGMALAAFPDRDHIGVVRQLEHWALAGTGQRKPVKDWAATYRTFLDGTPAGAPVRTRPASAGRESASDLLRAINGDAA